ncbi:hypothetical protein AHMF7605_09300 [Adhaeribacter arboris]|uniref:Uncharacterized protein n=1 Tax=Adhaeribacter arboris TaxID=2072846 RepID=A0A2T2YDX0_9BACT|nr:hypothetical protein [Adhaeribacter arboris]PSR53706.1 hypothetical protein AHMF7605_09300 [Adhaeribacter arboris]
MEITKEDFNYKFQNALDNILVAMAEHPDVDPKKFYSMTCILENLAFFGPVVYDAIQNSPKKLLSNTN